MYGIIDIYKFIEYRLKVSCKNVITFLQCAFVQEQQLNATLQKTAKHIHYFVFVFFFFTLHKIFDYFLI